MAARAGCEHVWVESSSHYPLYCQYCDCLWTPKRAKETKKEDFLDTMLREYTREYGPNINDWPGFKD